MKSGELVHPTEVSEKYFVAGIQNFNTHAFLGMTQFVNIPISYDLQ
jgi:hypothetical protein